MRYCLIFCFFSISNFLTAQSHFDGELDLTTKLKGFYSSEVERQLENNVLEFLMKSDSLYSGGNIKIELLNSGKFHKYKKWVNIHVLVFGVQSSDSDRYIILQLIESSTFSQKRRYIYLKFDEKSWRNFLSPIVSAYLENNNNVDSKLLLGDIQKKSLNFIKVVLGFNEWVAIDKTPNQNGLNKSIVLNSDQLYENRLNPETQWKFIAANSLDQCTIYMPELKTVFQFDPESLLLPATFFLNNGLKF